MPGRKGCTRCWLVCAKVAKTLNPKAASVAPGLNAASRRSQCMNA